LKSVRCLAIAFLCTLLAFLPATAQHKTKSLGADLVLRNGFIYTVDQTRTIAEAIAIRNRTIVFVGKDSDVTRYVTRQTRIIDLAGRMVLPGFVDSHCHPSGAYKQFYEISFNGVRTIPEYQRLIREYYAAHTGASYLKGRGWSNTLFPKSGPDKKLIDEIVGDIPVSLSSEDGHSKWVNSKALELAGITNTTPNPEGGVIEHDPATGEPTGTLRESAASLVAKLFADYSTEELMKGYEAYQRMALGFGITMAHDADIDPGSNEISAYKALEKDHRLVMRFRGSLYVGPKEGLEQARNIAAEQAKHRGPNFRILAAKLYADGVVEGSTAYLKEPYTHLPNSRGEFLWNQDSLNAMCTELDKHKLQIHVHAIGDGATAATLDAFAHAARVNGRRDARNMITHLQLVAPDDILRFKNLKVIAVTQPYWFMKDDYYYNIQVPYLGQVRADVEYPMESFFLAGVRVTSSSDYSVTIPCNPLVAIQTGITRSRPGVTDPKEVLWPEERATLDEMIASFTINGAYANFLEKETGSLEAGKLADIVVLEKNLFKIPATEISKTKVLMTLFEGREVFKDSSFNP
jgi:predicted amidohydrolase YtcJ